MLGSSCIAVARLLVPSREPEISEWRTNRAQQAGSQDLWTEESRRHRKVAQLTPPRLGSSMDVLSVLLLSISIVSGVAGGGWWGLSWESRSWLSCNP